MYSILRLEALSLLLFGSLAQADVMRFPGTGRVDCVSLGFETVRCDDGPNARFDQCQAVAVGAGKKFACADQAKRSPFRSVVFASPGIPAMSIALTPWRIQIGILLSLSVLATAVIAARKRKALKTVSTG